MSLEEKPNIRSCRSYKVMLGNLDIECSKNHWVSFEQKNNMVWHTFKITFALEFCAVEKNVEAFCIDMGRSWRYVIHFFRLFFFFVVYHYLCKKRLYLYLYKFLWKNIKDKYKRVYSWNGELMIEKWEGNQTLETFYTSIK